MCCSGAPGLGLVGGGLSVNCGAGGLFNTCKSPSVRVAGNMLGWCVDAVAHTSSSQLLGANTSSSQLLGATAAAQPRHAAGTAQGGTSRARAPAQRPAVVVEEHKHRMHAACCVRCVGCDVRESRVRLTGQRPVAAWHSAARLGAAQRLGSCGRPSSGTVARAGWRARSRHSALGICLCGTAAGVRPAFGCFWSSGTARRMGGPHNLAKLQLGILRQSDALRVSHTCVPRNPPQQPTPQVTDRCEASTTHLR